MAVQTSAGTTLGISTGVPSPYNTAGFVAKAPFSNVGEITDMGEFGTEYNGVTHTSLATRQVRKFKGSFDNGALTLQLGRDITDPGQIALRGALLSDASFSFKVTYQDGTINYFTAKVMSYKTSVGSVDQITGATVTLDIDGAIVEA